MSSEPTQLTGGLGYCGREARRHDPDRYLCSLFAAADARPRLHALLAFNIEVAKTAEVVSENLLGQIRLQWWRESIAGIYDGSPRHHAVVEPLAEAVAACGLTRGYFERIIDARASDLGGQQPESLDALETYATETSATLLWLAAEVLGAQGEAVTLAVRHVGIAWALAGILRAVPFHARAGRMLLPRDLSEPAGLAASSLWEQRSSGKLQGVVEAVSTRARAHLAQAREVRRDVPIVALPALLPAALADCYLNDLAKMGQDPFALAQAAPPRLNAWRLLFARLRRRY